MTSCRPSGTAIATFTYMPGFRTTPGLLKTRRTRTVRVVMIHLRQNLIDAAVEVASGIGIDRDLRRVARLQTAHVVLKHIGVHPYRGEIGDGVELRLRLHVGVRQGVALDDVAGDRRFDGDVVLHLAGLLRSAISACWNAELPQTLFGGLQQPTAFLRCAMPCASCEKRFLVLFGQQVFLLAAHKVRAVHGEKPLALAHILIGRIRKDILNPAGKAGLHVRKPFFVNVHIAGNAQIVVDILHLDGSSLDSNGLQTLGRNLHRRQ